MKPRNSAVVFPKHERRISNYRVGFCGAGTNVIPVRGGRFAPACCAAQQVIRRGPGCAVPHHQLPWAAHNLHRRSGLNQQNASAVPMKAVHSSSPPSFFRPDGCGLTGRSTGHFAASCGLHLWEPPTHFAGEARCYCANSERPTVTDEVAQRNLGRAE